MRGIALLLVLLCGLPAAASAETPRLLDRLDLASPASRAAHQVQVTRGEPASDTYMVGALRLPVAGIRLAPGGRLRAALSPGAGGGAGVSLLVTLATAPRDYGRRQAYRVQVDGQEVCRASERDPGGGLTRSICLDLPGPRRTLDVVISADPDTEAPVTVSSLRGYEPLPLSTVGRAAKAGPAARMGLALLTSKGLGYQIDAATMREMAARLPSSPYLDRQLAILYNFCIRDAAANAHEIDRLASLALETGIPLRVAFQMHWGGIPRGVPDGAGGTFSDLPYQQITFDPDDHVDDPGLAALMGDRYDVRFGLSVPNRWGDTPWLTFNHPRLNRFRQVRLTYALTAWKAARERLEAAGKGFLFPPELSTGEETIYWAKGVDDSRYTALNGGKHRANLLADFNPFVVADAQQDGVTLDPRDGFSNLERWWLHQNLGRWQQKITDWMLNALPPEPVRLTGAAPLFAPDLIRRNLYTEPYAMPCFPMKDVSTFHPGLEAGYVRDGRSGGEYWSGATMLPWLLKERERGRIALPNLECTGAGDPQLIACLQAVYACGARFATLYNWQHRSNIAALLRAFSDSIERPAGPEWLPDRSAGVIESSAAGTTMTRDYAAPDGAFGVNSVELFPADRAAIPARVRLTLRDMDPARAASVSVTTTLTSPVVPLPALFPQEPGRRYRLRVEVLQAGGAGFTLAADGRLAARLGADLRRERARSITLADWQDAADILASLQARHAGSEQSRYAVEALEEAKTLFAANRPRDAYRAAVRAEQLALPAAFDVPAPGRRLAPYWITVLCPGSPVRAVIRAYTDRTAVVSVRSAVAQTVIIRWGGFETTAALSPNVPAEITLDLGQSPAPRRPRRSTP